MHRHRRLFLGLLALLFPAQMLHADPTVKQDTLGPDGSCVGGCVSLKGAHAAVLASKGSHLEVLIDGVAGPKIDALLRGVSVGGVYQESTFWVGQVPIIYSDDGAHCAYMAKIGEEYVVMLDGKELKRGPLSGNSTYTIPLTFSSGGKHLFYSDDVDSSSYHIVVDGQPGPVVKTPPSIAFSPDGSHYAYIGEYTRQGAGVWSFVDGKQVNFFGDQLQYTAHNVLLAEIAANSSVTLTLNGKPAIKAANINPMWISKDGAQIAMVLQSNNNESILAVNAKTIPDTHNIQVENVYFSNDGKRWAARCRTKLGSEFMIVDGKKLDDYKSILGDANPAENLMHWRFVTGNQMLAIADAEPHIPGFTGDSSKFVYVASTGARQFLVVDDNESDGYTTILPSLSPAGNHVGMIATGTDQKQHVIVDDKETTIPPATSGTSSRCSVLTFSPDGAHCAFIHGQELYLDDKPQPGIVNSQTYVFSPDGNHIAYQASFPQSSPCFVVDGKAITDKAMNPTTIFFSPDSKHIYFVARSNLQSLGTKDSYMLYVDGKPATHFEPPINGDPIRWDFTPDDEVDFVAITDGNVRRFHVTSDTDLSTVLSAAKAAPTN